MNQLVGQDIHQQRAQIEALAYAAQKIVVLQADPIEADDPGIEPDGALLSIEPAEPGQRPRSPTLGSSRCQGYDLVEMTRGTEGSEPEELANELLGHRLDLCQHTKLILSEELEGTF